MKYLLLLVCVTGLYSCTVTVHGLDNQYTKLTPEQQRSLRSFSPDDVDAVRDQKNQLSVEEITVADIKSCLHKYPYSLVYLWDVNCTSDHCKPLFYYERIEKGLRARGLKVFMVSETYQLGVIKGNAERSDYDRDLYVLKDAEYGHRLQRSRAKFYDEMAPGDKENKTEHNSRYMIFKGDKLIYHGLAMSEHIADSVLNSN